MNTPVKIITAVAVGLSFFFLSAGPGRAASTQPTATPDTISIGVQEADISMDDLTFTTVFENKTDSVDLTAGTDAIFGQIDQVPVGSYRVLRLTVTEISWHAKWSPANPKNLSPCDGADSGEATGLVDLGGHTDFYFKTADLGGNTLAYYLAHPPQSGYVGDADHPFLLSSPATVQKDSPTTINLVIGVANTLTCDSVDTFDLSGNKMIPTLLGPATRLQGAEGIYVDTNNNQMVVTNSGDDSVIVYDSAVSGDHPPLGTPLMGPATRLNDPEGISVDTVNNEMVVANRGNNSITVYNRTASENTPPLRTITGSFTGLDSPRKISVDTIHNEIVVANSGNNSITVYSRMASEDAVPLRAISRFILTVGDNVIKLTETGGLENVDVTIAPGVYRTGADLAKGIALAFEAAVSANTRLTATYDDNTGQFTFTMTAKPGNVTQLTFHWSASNSAGVLGFKSVGTSDDITLKDINSSMTSNLDKLELTGLNKPCGVYVDTKDDEIGVANNGNGTITIYNRTDNGNVAPKQTLTGLSNPCGIYVDMDHDQIGVADSGNGTVTIFQRIAGAYTLDHTITGLNNPRDLFLDTVHSEIRVTHRGQQIVMAHQPPIFPSGSNTDANSSVLAGDYNVVFYGVDLKGVNGHGTPIPLVFAERGTANFAPPDFSFNLDRQIKRQVIEPDCPTDPDLGQKKSGSYGVNGDGSFYAFIPGVKGSVQGAFVPDGSAFVGTIYDSSNRLQLVYGVKQGSSNTTPYLTSDGTSSGVATHYAMTTYRNDAFEIGRFDQSSKTNDSLGYLIGVGMAETDDLSFLGISSDANFVTVVNPMGEFALPHSPGPIYREGFPGLSITTQSYNNSDPGVGLLENIADGLSGAVTSDGATLIFLRDITAKDGYGCPNNIGFGMGLRQSPAGTFSTQSLKGTYSLAAFGDRYNSAAQTSLHRSTAAGITFDGAGGAVITSIENAGGTISVDRSSFIYQVSTKTIPRSGDTLSKVDVVDIFVSPATGVYASALIGPNGKSLSFYRSLYPKETSNLTRLLGLAVFQHP